MTIGPHELERAVDKIVGALDRQLRFARRDMIFAHLLAARVRLHGFQDLPTDIDSQLCRVLQYADAAENMIHDQDVEAGFYDG